MRDILILSAMCRGHFRLLKFQKFEILKKHALGPFARPFYYCSKNYCMKKELTY